MKKRLIIFLISIILVSVLGTALISSFFSIENYMAEEERSLAAYSNIIASVMMRDYDNGVKQYMSEYAEMFSADTGYRITIIDSDGSVLADSEAKENYINMNNHGAREEVREAFNKGYGSSRRESESFGREYLYVSSLSKLGSDEQVVVRIAMEINKWNIAKDQVIKSSAIAAMIGIILAVIIALLYTSRIMQPVNEMEAQLKKALEESEKAEKIRKDFVANVTHELKTPLTSITGFVETMQDDPELDPKTRSKFLDIIALESSRLTRLIDDILIISDIESGRETNKDEDINVKQAINEVLHTLVPLAASKGVELKFDFQYEMYIGGNYDRFKQMMFNLIENAIKYSEPDTDVRINCERKDKIDDENEGYISNTYIRIKDQGIGIAEENMDRLFERFYRVDKSRSQKAGGTGLGLAIVKHIATLFGAEINITSKLNEGTEFTLIFPTTDKH